MWTGYFPIGHTVEPEYNLDRDQVTRWVRDVMQTPNIPKLYANSLYDIGNCTDDSIYTTGEIHDVQFAEALLSEDENVDLDALGEKYLGKGKETNRLYAWCADAYGGDVNGAQRSNIYRASPRIVGPYAEEDSRMLYPILQKQLTQLNKEGLVDLYRMECELVILLIRMRIEGITIDMPYAEKLYGEVTSIIHQKQAQIKATTGVSVADSAPSGDIAKVFDACGIPYRITPKTKKPSITDDDLKIIVHPAGALCRELRQHDKVRGTFIRNGLLESSVNGVLHGEFHPLRGMRGGARTGRFASSNPNLQNIPVRTELGKLIRKAYIPNPGHLCWEDDDFSQYEYRILAHFAVGPGSDELRAEYCNDPNTDYHTRTTGMIKSSAYHAYQRWEAQGLDGGKIRKRVKTINFGLMNAMGIDLLAAELGISKNEAAPLLEVYHTANPYVKATIKDCEQFAQANGFITTFLGRKRRFNLWEPRPEWDEETRTFAKQTPLRYHHAIRVYGPMIHRAMTHIALNSRTQGTNADGMKKSMVLAHKAGIFDVTGVPKLTVHDSLSFSVIDDTPIQREAFKELRHIMETALALRVPVRVDSERGPNWGDLHA
ncbi:MAG: DNA polymerase [Minisyncoccia bacterium]